MAHEAPTSVLVTITWWRALANRLGRQAAQTVLPILAVLTATPAGVDLRSVVLATAGTLSVTLAKSTLLAILDIKPSGNAPLAWQLVDRIVPAFAGVLVGLWPTSAEGFLTFDVRGALVAALAAAVAAAIGYVVAPPLYTEGPLVAGPVGEDVTSIT